MKTKILIILIVGVILTGGGFAIWYSQIPRCPESCDDGNPCTQDTCSKETNYKCSYTKLTEPQPGCSAEVTCGKEACKTGVCQIDYIADCCGNKICEVGETYKTCSADCPNCDDNNELTEDSFNFTTQKCEHITPPSITVTSPSGGEKWIIGNNYEISWSCKNISENRLSFRYFVNIHLLQNNSFYGEISKIAIGGMSGYAYHAISDGCVWGGTQTYSWVAGSMKGGAGPGDNFQVKVGLTDLEGVLIVSDISEGYFSIIEP